jgi:acetyltransferase-like isoleucine patch superfamily enzyme
MSIDRGAFIHSNAVVEDGATIGSGTRVWLFTQVRGGAVIGADCNIAKRVFVDNGVVIGDRCKIANNVSIHDGVSLGDEVFVGMGTVFTNDQFPRAQNPNWVKLCSSVGDGASIGASCTIGPGRTIGSFAMVGMGSTVIRDVEDHEMVAGNPARHIGWVCDCGRIASRDNERPVDLRCPGCIEVAAEPVAQPGDAPR